MRTQRLVMTAIACAALLGPAAGFAQTAAPSNSTSAPGVSVPTSVPTTANPGKPANTMSMPSVPGTSKMPATPGMASAVNVNTASAADLDKLPQIGPKRAAKIIAGRPYKTTDELVSKKAISQGVFNKIKTMITAS